MDQKESKLKIDYRSKLRKRALNQTEKASKSPESNKNDVKQVVVSNKNDNKKTALLDVVYNDDATLKELIRKLSKQLVLNQVPKKERAQKILDCKSAIAK